jgi:hypothetical protein
MKSYFACWFRLDGGSRYLIWFSVESAGSDLDGVFVDAEGRVPIFRTLAELERFAVAQGLDLVKEEPILIDLDAAYAWLRWPTRDVRRIHTRGELLAAWNLCSDLSRSVDGGFAPLDLESAATLPIWHELLMCEKTHWSSAELRILRRVLRQGLTLFRERIQLQRSDPGT